MATTHTNEAHPARPSRHKLGRLAVAVAVGAILLLTACDAVLLTKDQGTAMAALNRDRSAARVSTLGWHAPLVPSAQAWARHLADAGALSHDDSKRWAPRCATAWAENVGYGRSLASIEAGFMASPMHRRNIIDPRYTKAVTTVVQQGLTYWVVQRFVAGC